MKNKISILILMLLSLFLYITPAASEVYMGEVGVNNIIEVNDEAHMFPVFFAFKQPPAIRPFSLYFIKRDVSSLWYYKDGWQKVNSGNPNNLIPLFQTSDASEIDKIKFFNVPLPLSFFTGGSTTWADLTVSICLDEENTNTGIADMGSDNHNCGSLTFINKTGNGGGAPGGQVTYTVTLSAGVNGSITPSTPQSVNQGSTTAFTVTPNNGYIASVGGTCGGTLSGNTYTTGPINADCTVSATFTANAATHIVTPSAGLNGSITPSTPQSIKDGYKTSFQVNPASGYTASVGGTCGGNLVGTTYTTNAINADCTVAATFNSSTPGGYTGGSPLPFGGSCSPTAINISDIITMTADPGVTLAGSSVAVTDNCRKGVAYTASVIGSSPWLSVQGSGNGTLVVTVDTRTGKGANTAGQYKGSVKVSSPGLTGATVQVVLTVTGPAANCTAASAVVSPLSIDKIGAGAASITIKDNCGNNLNYTDTISYSTGAGWISAPASGNGQLNVTLTSSGLTAGARYIGAITITPYGYPAVTIQIALTVSQSQASNVTAFTNAITARFWAEANKPYYYSKYIQNSAATPNNTTLVHGVVLKDFSQTQTGSSGGTHNVDVLVKYAGPTCDTAKLPDFNLLSAVKAYCTPITACQPVLRSGAWLPARYGEAQGMELFYKLSGGSDEMVDVIGVPLPEGCYYFMLYNWGPGRGYIEFSAS